MKYLLLLLISLLPVGVFAQVQKQEIRGFRGLNTQAGAFSIKPNESIVAQNIDFSRNGIGSLSKRLGYDSVGYKAGSDSIVSIYGAYYSDGTQQLIFITDSSGVGYGNVWVTPKGSIDLSAATMIWQYWGVQSPTHFAMHGDRVYMINGSQKGIVWDGDIARSFPLNAPGEPKFTPLLGGTTGYSLSGEFRYQWSGAFYVGGSVHSLQYSAMSSLVRVSSGHILMTDVPYLQTDSIGWFGDSTKNKVDSMRIKLSRTKANPGIINSLDSTWVVLDTTLDSSGFNGFTFIDSISDDSMVGSKVALLHLENHGRDSTGAINRRLGAPSYINAYGTLAYTTVTDTTDNNAVYHGIPKQNDTLGVAYVVSYMDTITGVESDTGRACVIWVTTANRSGANKPRGYRIGLPPLASNDTGIVYNLYRAHVLQVTHDSAFNVIDSMKQAGDKVIKTSRDAGNSGGWVNRLVVDTIVLSEFRLIAQISSDSTRFTDSSRWDSLANQRRYFRATPPSLMTSIISFEDKMWGSQGSRLYISRLDSAQSWGGLSFISLNESDGDEITTIYPMRGIVRVLKNKSAYNVYQDANLNWNRTEISGLYGSIAKSSYAKGFAGHYFLSDVGVLRENEGQFLERTQASQLVSQRLDNFDKLSIVAKSNARAFFYDQKYLLSIGDTTYVYDEKADAWSTWSMTFADATLYGVESNVGFFPGDTMYFIKAGESNLYRYGSSENDLVSGVLQIDYKTGPLFIGSNKKKIDFVNIWINASDTSTGVLVIQLYGEDGVLTGGSGITLNTTSATRLMRKSVKPAERLYYNLRLVSAAASLTSSYIDGIDIEWKNMGIKGTD